MLDLAFHHWARGAESRWDPLSVQYHIQLTDFANSGMFRCLPDTRQAQRSANADMVLHSEYDLL